jgi:hypothetical protein
MHIAATPGSSALPIPLFSSSIPLRARCNLKHFVITDRAGCDLHPVDATSTEGRLLLTSFVWPFDLDRHKRLSLALAIAAMHPVPIDKASAGRWLRAALTDELDGLPVVWHSVTQMYWPRDEMSDVEEILSRYGTRHLLGEVSLGMPQMVREAEARAAYAAVELGFRRLASGTQTRHRHDHGSRHTRKQLNLP